MSAGALAARGRLEAEISALFAELGDVAGALAECCEVLGDAAAGAAAQELAETSVSGTTAWAARSAVTSAAVGVPSSGEGA